MQWHCYTPHFEYEKMFQDMDWPWAGHKCFAYDLVRNIQPKKIVELGTHKGTSFFSFCQAVKDGNIAVELNAVDTWKGEKHAGFYDESVWNEVNTIKRIYYNTLKIELLRKTFDEAVNDFQDNSIDILHIDGLHTYEAVKHDFDTWINKVSENGIILFHDISEIRDDFGVYKLWNEIKEKHKTIEFHHSHGLGVLFKKVETFQNIFNFQELLTNYYFINEENKSLQLKIKENNQEIKQKNEENCELYKAKEEKEKILKDILNSWSWKLTWPLRIIGSLLLIVKDIPLAWNLLRREGIKTFFRRIVLYSKGKRLDTESTEIQYQEFIKNNKLTDKQTHQINNDWNHFTYQPKISIITPVYNVNPIWLNKCIQSVQNQYYKNWELCLYDDASTQQETIDYLKKYEGTDSRIKISFGKNNQHISGASNEAIKMATGEFIALLDNDDELTPNALYEVVKLLNIYPEADLIYSDEGKITTEGKRNDPFFKPDWSPDLFLSMNYISHLGVYRKSIIDTIGGFRKGFEGSQDYDLVLRFIEKTKSSNIFHIPKILYHWRQVPSSTASGMDKKNYAVDSSIKALQEYLSRQGITGTVENNNRTGYFRIKRQIIATPLVSIIIPFRDQLSVLKRCINSIQNKTNYKNYELILVNNQSQELGILDYLKSLSTDSKITVLDYNSPFNYSAINNFAVKEAKGEYILFLNNDIEIINNDWLDAMGEHIQREEVGAVGAKLLYPNNTIQHAGVIMGLGIAGHAFKHFRTTKDGYFCMLNVIRNYSAVTGACLLTKKSLFEEIGGFNEKELSVAYNDVDFCLRLRERGYLIVYTPYAQLYHYESISRGNDNDKELKYSNPEKYKRVLLEREYMQNKWRTVIEHDPYYNPNLTREHEDFSINMQLIS